MASLIVSGITVSVASNESQSDSYEDYGGELVRMFDGSMGDTRKGYKRAVGITTTLIADATAATLVAAVNNNTQPLTCSGDILGGSGSWYGRVTANVPKNVAGALYRVVSFTLMQA